MKKKLLKLLIILGSIILIIVGILCFFSYQVEKAINPDPDYNTVHSTLFNENKFLELKPGMSANQVVDLIGEPFDVYTPKPVHRILYTDYDVSIDYGSGVSINDTAKEISFLVLSFDTLELAISIFNRNFCDSKKEDYLIEQTYTDVISKLGNPKQEVICSCNGSIWNYSKLRDGGYRGKHPVINIRRLIFTPVNKLEKIIIGEGSPYNKYWGICNE